MSDDVLELARRVWPAAQPSQDDVDRAVRRVRRRLGRRRARPRRVISVATAIAVGCISAVVWAAASAWLAPDATHGAVPRLAPALRAAAGAALRAEAPQTDGASHPGGAPHSAGAPLSAGASPTDVPTAASDDDSAWKQIGDALGAGKERRAAELLRGLAQSNDAQTRGKAALGLAQLAASRGDCAQARALAAGVIHDAASPTLTRRAQALVSQCR